MSFIHLAARLTLYDTILAFLDIFFIKLVKSVTLDCLDRTLLTLIFHHFSCMSPFTGHLCAGCNASVHTTYLFKFPLLKCHLIFDGEIKVINPKSSSYTKVNSQSWPKFSLKRKGEKNRSFTRVNSFQRVKASTAHPLAAPLL